MERLNLIQPAQPDCSQPQGAKSLPTWAQKGSQLEATPTQNYTPSRAVSLNQGNETCSVEMGQRTRKHQDRGDSLADKRTCVRSCNSQVKSEATETDRQPVASASEERRIPGLTGQQAPGSLRNPVSNYKVNGQEWCTPLTPAFRRQRQEDLLSSRPT